MTLGNETYWLFIDDSKYDGGECLLRLKTAMMWKRSPSMCFGWAASPSSQLSWYTSIPVGSSCPGSIVPTYSLSPFHIHSFLLLLHLEKINKSTLQRTAGDGKLLVLLTCLLGSFLLSSSWTKQRRRWQGENKWGKVAWCRDAHALLSSSDAKACLRYWELTVCRPSPLLNRIPDQYKVR